MSHMNRSIQSAFPMVMAPNEGPMPEATQSGIRFVAASDGLYREIDLPWVRSVHRIAKSELALPYGATQEYLQFKCSSVPARLWQQFKTEAHAALPNEMAAALVWNHVTDKWRFALRHAVNAGPGHVAYREVVLQADEHLVVDLHSHASIPAFFSQEDDADDWGAMKLSAVIGELNQVRPSTVMRLSLAGRTWKARLDDQGNFEVTA